VVPEVVNEAAGGLPKLPPWTLGGILELPAFVAADLKVVKSCPEDGEDRKTDDYELMTIEEIMCGKENYYPGLIPLVKTYLDMIKCDVTTRARVDKYLDLVERRCTGKLMTAAAWFRRFALFHPDYKQNSVLTHAMVYDIVEAVHQIAKGRIRVPQLLDEHVGLPPDPQLEKDRGPYLAGQMPQATTPLQSVELKLPSSKGCAIFRAFLDKHLKPAFKKAPSGTKVSGETQKGTSTEKAPSLTTKPTTPMVTTNNNDCGC